MKTFCPTHGAEAHTPHQSRPVSVSKFSRVSAESAVTVSQHSTPRAALSSSEVDRRDTPAAPRGDRRATLPRVCAGCRCVRGAARRSLAAYSARAIGPHTGAPRRPHGAAARAPRTTARRTTRPHRLRSTRDHEHRDETTLCRSKTKRCTDANPAGPGKKANTQYRTHAAVQQGWEHDEWRPPHPEGTCPG